MLIKEAILDEDIKDIAVLAHEIWHEYFPLILSNDQIDYMVEKFQSYHAMKEQICKEGYVYYKLLLDDKLIGYTAISINEEHKSIFLSKLYIHKSYRGLGYGSRVFQFLKELCLEKGLRKVWLTVNRFNENTIKAYEKRGFEKVDTRVLDIGNGYVMDDYIMEWLVS